jgi:hypothetical protein
MPNRWRGWSRVLVMGLGAVGSCQTMPGMECPGV